MHTTGVRWWKAIVSVSLCAATLLLAACAGAPEPPGAPAALVADDADSTAGAGVGEDADALPPEAASEPQAGASAEEGAESQAQQSAGRQAEGAPLAPGAADDEAPPSGPPDHAAFLALAAPGELLDSYRVASSFVVTSLLPGGAQHVASTQVQGTWVRTAGPFGFDAAFTLLNSSGDQRQALDLVAIGDDAAMQTGGVWSTIRRDSDLPYTNPDSVLSLPFVSRINRGENLGREQLAGVEVTHYRLTDPRLFAAAMQDILPNGAGSVQSVLLEGWVADAGFVVRYLLQADLSDVDFTDEAGNHVAVQQEMYASYALSDVDTAPPIEWPADAQPPDTISVPGFVPNTFPLPEGGTATPRLGLLEIRTQAAESEVAAFYRARLAEQGWSVEGELGFYSAVKDGQALSLTILPDEASGETVVRVFAAVTEP